MAHRNTHPQSSGGIRAGQSRVYDPAEVPKERLGIRLKCSLQGLPDSFAEGSQRQLPIVCSRHCVHAYPAQDADTISLILKDMALIADNDLHQ